MTIHLSILLFFPLALAPLGALLPGRVAPFALLAGSLAALAYAVPHAVRLRHRASGLQYVTDDTWIEGSASAIRSASMGSTSG